MKSKNIPYNEISVLSPLMTDYLLGKENVEVFYKTTPNKDGILHSIPAKKPLSIEARSTLVNSITQQYEQVKTSALTHANIQSILKDNTYTITTGHQLNLASGPLYVIYKILSVINAAELLSQEKQDVHVVPVFWLATEDHDFEEINHCHLLNNTIRWNTPSGNATGRLPTDDLMAVIEHEFTPLLEKFDAGSQILSLLKQAYLNSNTLGKATFSLFNELFGSMGLVILDADDKALKNLFSPIIKQELVDRKSQGLVNIQNELLEKQGYKTQAHARDINLFLLHNNTRDRITFENDRYVLVNSEQSFSKTEMLELATKSPELFSPNVILRPVYQECILPNLAYIGGAGELAYWLQLKSVFEDFDVDFPALMLRNAGAMIQANQIEKMNKLHVSFHDLFKSNHQLTSDWINDNTASNINLDAERQLIQTAYDNIVDKATSIDPTLKASILGAISTQLKTVDGLEKKLLKAEKNKHEVALNQLTKLQNQLFPNGQLQERHDNIFGFIAKYGFQVIDELKTAFNPFDTSFTIVEL